MKNVIVLTLLLLFISVFSVQAAMYTGVMDTRAGQQYIPGMTAQSKAWISGGDPGEGVRLEWQVDNVSTLGSWTYTYRLLRGNSKNKGFAFFDIETASDFTAANILSKQVNWALTKNGTQLEPGTVTISNPLLCGGCNPNTILAGLEAVFISDPLNFNAVHDFSNAAVTEASAATALNKNDLSHYSGDPGRVPPGMPGLDASLTPSVGPVPHPFYGIRVTFPGTLAIIAYEAVEWEFKIVSDRPPMWGSFFGWGDQTLIPPYWYSNMYNNNIDNPNRLTLPPASCNFGESPCQGWILVPGPAPAAQASFLRVNRATYSREASGTGTINLFAEALSNPNLNLTVSGAGFASPVVMNRDPLRNYFANIPFTSLPASVLLDNSFDPPAIAPYAVPLVDEVSISQATFDPAARIVTLKAASQDKLAPLPTLRAIDFATPNEFDVTGTFTTTVAGNPPTTVTVLSSKGGVATATVTITAAPQIVPPVANNDTAATTSGATITIPVLANDTAGTNAINPATVVVTQPAAGGGTAVANANGTVSYTAPATPATYSFTYTVKDSSTPTPATSNVATVTVTVAAPTPPTANNDTTSAATGTTITIPVLNNDSAGTRAINPATVVVTAPTGGTAIANANGTVSYTAPAAAGTYTFTYTVQDSAVTPLTSNSATVTVTVITTPPEILTVNIAQFTTVGSSWRVEGTTSKRVARESIKIFNGPTVSSPLLGTAVVDPNGVWKFSLKPGAAPNNQLKISIQSSLVPSATLEGVTVTVN